MFLAYDIKQQESLQHVVCLFVVIPTMKLRSATFCKLSVVDFRVRDSVSDKSRSAVRLRFRAALLSLERQHVERVPARHAAF